MSAIMTHTDNIINLCEAEVVQQTEDETTFDAMEAVLSNKNGSNELTQRIKTNRTGFCFCGYLVKSFDYNFSTFVYLSEGSPMCWLNWFLRKTNYQISNPKNVPWQEILYPILAFWFPHGNYSIDLTVLDACSPLAKSSNPPSSTRSKSHIPPTQASGW